MHLKSVKLVFEAVSQLKYLVEKNGKRQQFEGKTERVNSRNYNEEKQPEQDFISDNNAIQKKDKTSSSETIQNYQGKGKEFLN